MRKDIFGLAKQTGLGTKQTTMEYFPPVEEVDPGHDRETIEVEETTGTRFPSGIDYGVEFWEITANGPARFNSLPRIVSGFLGPPTSTQPDATGAPTAWQHSFDPAAGGGVNPVPHSLFVVRNDPSPAIVDLFWDALGDELSFEVEPNAFLSWEAAWIARELDDTQAAPSATYDVSKRMAFDACKAYLSVNGGAETEIAVASFGLTYSNDIPTDDQEVLGSRRLFTIEPGNASAEVSFAPRESLGEHYRRALLNDPESCKIRLEALGALIGGTVSYKVEVVVHACEYVEAPAPVNAAERLSMVEVTARAKYDETTSKFVTVNVVNEVASY